MINQIIARLLEAGTPFSAVEGAISFAAIEDHRHGTPAAYVIAPEDASGDNERMSGKILQRNEGDIAIIIVLNDLSDIGMSGAATDLEALKSFVRGKLLGFKPTGSEEPMEHISGRLMKARNGTIWHEEMFSLVTYLEEV